MSEQNKALVRRWYDEVWNRGSEAAIDELFPPDAQSFGFPDPGSVLTGPEAFKAVHRQFHDAFSGIQIRIDEMVAEGETVAVRWSATFSHTGGGLGFPPSGRPASLAGAAFYQFQDGRFRLGWTFMDFTRLALELQAAHSVSKPISAG